MKKEGDVLRLGKFEEAEERSARYGTILQMQLATTIDKVEEVKAKVIVANTELVVQFVEGFNSTMEQVKVLADDMDYGVVNPFKEVVNRDIVEVVDWDANLWLVFLIFYVLNILC